MMTVKDLNRINLELNEALFERFNGASWVQMRTFEHVDWDREDNSTVSLATLSCIADSTGVAALDELRARVDDTLREVFSRELSDEYRAVFRERYRTNTYADGESTIELIVVIALKKDIERFSVQQ